MSVEVVFEVAKNEKEGLLLEACGTNVSFGMSRKFWKRALTEMEKGTEGFPAETRARILERLDVLREGLASRR